MYKLKNNKDWEDVKETFWKLNSIAKLSDDFDDYFEKVEIENVPLKNGTFELKNKEVRIIYRCDDYSIFIEIEFSMGGEFKFWIGEYQEVKSIEDFNRRFGTTFGFNIIKE